MCTPHRHRRNKVHASLAQHGPDPSDMSIATGPAPATASCACCGVTRPDADLRRCTGCKRAQYCGKQCQTRHWNEEGGHKQACRKQASIPAAGRHKKFIACKVRAGEAALFTQLCAILKPTVVGGMVTGITAEESHRLVKLVEDVAGKALGNQPVHAHVKGSVAKGTNLVGSDIDVVVDTPGRTITRADQEKVVAHLKEHPDVHWEHVTLKQVAIQIMYRSKYVDVVFADCGAEISKYGTQPMDPRFEGNLAAQSAARALKTATGAAECTVSGFVLEMIVLHAQGELNLLGGAQEESQIDTCGDGSLQIFLSALQAIADSDGAAILNTVQDTKKVKQTHREDVAEVAANLLHVFYLSRFFFPGQEFRHLCDVECWITQFRCEDSGTGVANAFSYYGDGAPPVWFSEPAVHPGSLRSAALKHRTSIGRAPQAATDSTMRGARPIVADSCDCVTPTMTPKDVEARLTCRLAEKFAAGPFGTYCRSR